MFVQCLTAPPPGCPLIPGDVNDDDVVSVLDLVAVTNNILGLGDLPEGSECAADIDGNGIINVTVSVLYFPRDLFRGMGEGE